jgi:carnitine O-acetyltransferase
MDYSPNHVVTPIPKSAKNLQQLPSACAASGLTAIATTYDNQNGLPRLPIPELEDTIARFQARLEALHTTPDERDVTQRICNEFLARDGPVLQQALRDYEADGVAQRRIGSYIEEFWNESYLSPDTSVVLNLNPFFLLETHPDPKIANDQLKRAASLCFAALKMASTMRHQKLTPDIFRGKPLCMDQFKALFGSSRQPKVDGDDDVVSFFSSSWQPAAHALPIVC